MENKGKENPCMYTLLYFIFYFYIYNYTMWYRPENTNIDRGEAEVNMGILLSISHHI